MPIPTDILGPMLEHLRHTSLGRLSSLDRLDAISGAYPDEDAEDPPDLGVDGPPGLGDDAR